MASFDFGSQSAYKFALAGVNVAALTNSAAIDTAGYEGVAVVCSVGVTNVVSASTNIALAFVESADTNISNGTAVASGFIGGSTTLDANNTAFWTSVKTSKRYLFAKLTPTATNANVHVIGALGFPNSAPTQ